MSYKLCGRRGGDIAKMNMEIAGTTWRITRENEDKRETVCLNFECTSTEMATWTAFGGCMKFGSRIEDFQ